MTTDDKRSKRRPYEPPAIEDVPINPEERLLVPCKGATGTNPICMAACSTCFAVGS